MSTKTSSPLGFHGGSSRELEALLTEPQTDSHISKPSSFSVGRTSFDDLKSLWHSSSKDMSPSYILSISSALLYGSVGLVMGFANKAVLQQWPYSNTFLTFQMVTTIVIVYLLKALRLIAVRPLELKSARNLVWVVFFYNANVAFALAAVRALSIPVYHVMKRLTPVMVLSAKAALGDKKPPLQVTLSVLTVVAGCIFAGLGDLSFDGMGYIMALISCALQTTYLLMVERSGSEKGYNSNELLLYNAVLSLPVLIVIVYLTGESSVALVALQKLNNTEFIALLSSSLVMGSLLNYALFFCTITNSALSTTIVGTLRSVFGTILGFFVLGGVKATPLIIVGVSTNTAGGVWYTVVKYRMRQEKKAELQPQVPQPDLKRNPV